MRNLLESLCRKGPDVERHTVPMLRPAALMLCPNCDRAYEAGGPTARVACPACGSPHVCAARLVPVVA